MMNPLMKAPINSISKETQSGLNAIQAELHAQRKLLKELDNKISAHEKVAKVTDKMLGTQKVANGTCSETVRNANAVVEHLGANHFDSLQDAAQEFCNEVEDFLRNNPSQDVVDRLEESGLVKASKIMCDVV